MKPIYLDNATTTKMSDLAVSRMLPFFTEYWGSPSAPHQKGQELFPSIEEGMQALYALLDANSKDDIILTSSGAEAINHAIFSVYYEITRATGKNQFITTSIEEAPILMSIGRLEQMGCVGKMVEVGTQGYVTAQQIADALNPRTALVSMSWANGFTGVINPVKEIAKLCQERGVLLHLDATHILGKVYYSLEDIGAHFITFNGDQLHGPKGTGGLYVKSGTHYAPFIVGGAEQAGHRAGTLNIPGLVAMGCAAREIIEHRDLVCVEIARLRNKLEAGIMKGFPEAIPLFRKEERLPSCTSILFPGVPNEALLYNLNHQNVYASIGGGTFQQIGLVLKACGIDEILANTGICFSLSRDTTEDEIDRAIQIVVNEANKLKSYGKLI